MCRRTCWAALILAGLYCQFALAQTPSPPPARLVVPAKFAETATPTRPVPMPLLIPITPTASEPKSSPEPKATLSPTPDAKTPAPTAPATESAAIAELGKKLGEVAKNITVTTGDSEFKLLLGGAIIGDFVYSTKRPIASGTPFFLPPGTPTGNSTQTFDAHARQTTLFGAFTGPDVLDCKMGGMVMVNLYDNSVVADRYGLLPIVAYGELKNEEMRFAAGYNFDLFNPINPTILPFSLLTGSGNTGMFRGQVRYERYLALDDETILTVAAAASEPIPTTLSESFRISEDNGIPNFEGRVSLGLGALEGEGFDQHRPFEVGVSGVWGELRTVDPTKRVISTVWGLGLDAWLALDPDYGFRGEVFMGKGLGTYAGAILQTINTTTFRTIQSSGGWVEGYYYVVPECVHVHLGYGIDDPIDSDVTPTGPIRNDSFYATTIWDVSKAVRIGFQASYVRTAYKLPKDNEGFVFDMQFQWKF